MGILAIGIVYLLM